MSENLRDGFAAAGYPLLTTRLAPHGLIEVYPHPALVELAGASTRLPYKTSRVRSYWPRTTPSERRERLLLEWRKIVDLLEQEITGVRAALPLPTMQLMDLPGECVLEVGFGMEELTFRCQLAHDLNDVNCPLPLTRQIT